MATMAMPSLIQTNHLPTPVHVAAELQAKDEPMKQDDIVAAIREGLRQGLAEMPREPAKPMASPLVVASLIAGLVVQAAGGLGWLMALSSRISVVESKQTSLETAAEQIAALKQEVTDFRGEFREWKMGNMRDRESK